MTISLKSDAGGTFGSLLVGANEAFRFGSDNSGQLAGFRNKIINGAMQVWQRGAAISGAGTYTADRFLVQAATVAIPVVRATGFLGTQYALQMQGAIGNTGANAQQRIESANCQDLVGKAVTISAALYGAASANWQLLYPTVVDNFTTLTAISSGTWAVTGAGTKFSATIPNLPAGVANGLVFMVLPNSGGAFTAGALTITNMQLEEGSIATPFEQRPIGLELSLCQRYYKQYVGAGFGIAAIAQGGFPIYFPVTMRSPPTISNGSLSAGTFASASITTDGLTVYNSGAGWIVGATLAVSFIASAEL